MDKYVLLLGAVNVSGKNTLPMKELVSHLSDAGYSEVKTYIQSGNVVLCHARRPDVEHLGQVIEQGFGFVPLIWVYSAEEFTQLAQVNPYPSAKGNQSYIYFARDNVEWNTTKMGQYQTGSEEYLVSECGLYAHFPDGLGRSKLAAKIPECVTTPVTARNFNTVNKLLLMLS